MPKKNPHNPYLVIQPGLAASAWDIVSFMAPKITMNKILEAYPQYSKDLIIHILEDHIEDVQDQSKISALRIKVERWKLGFDDDELLDLNC